ncbi:MAG: hypothetical protein AB7H93_18200 [Vicinamibacterales bacterium]
MHLLLAVPDGVGVRNFVLGRFLHELAASEHATILHGIPDALLDGYRTQAERRPGAVTWRPLLPYREALMTFGLRYALSYAHTYWADTYAMRRIRDEPLRGSWRTRAIHRASRTLGWVAGSSRGVQTLRRSYETVAERQPEVASYERLLRDLAPSVVFCSNQRAGAILPLVIAGRRLGIPTVSFVFSWDNLTSKGRVAAPFDYYVVWSRHMQQELLTYYEDVTADRVRIVGTPQFDPYADQTLLWSRTECFRRLNADPGRPLLCYSGGDRGTTPEDPAHVRILLELIRSGAIRDNPQVVLRPAPPDDGARYDPVRRDHPELIWSPPAWFHADPGSWLASLPLAEDVQLLANLTHHADLNVNMASTMTLDFALHDKPVVNVAFDVASPPVLGTPVWELYYRYEHYRPVVELGAARFARSPQELAAHVNAYLENPALDRDGRRRLTELQIGRPLGQSARHTLDALRAIAREHHAATA